MEEENYVPASSMRCCSTRIMSPEIVEMEEDSKSIANTIDRVANDIYVAVGKDDMDILKWALDHAVSPGAKVFLVHVFPPITYIPTPVGRLSMSQLSRDQLRFYINEENNRRRNLLQKYIRFCTDAKMTVDTLLIESNHTSKALLDLIPVLNIANLVMGTKRPPGLRILRKKLATAEYVRKNAPDYCEVTIVHDGNKVKDGEQEKEVVHSSPSSSPHRPNITHQSEWKFFECACFTGKFD